MKLLFVAGLMIISFIVGRKTTNKFGPKSTNKLTKLRQSAAIAIEQRTSDRQDKLLAYIRDETNRQSENLACNPGSENSIGVTRREIETILEISENTAYKYIQQLEDQGLVEQIGTGPNTRYIPAK